MDGIAALHRTDNFHFAHLLVVMYEADSIRMQYLQGADAADERHKGASFSQTSANELTSSVSQASARIIQVLIDFILSFIQQNRQTIMMSVNTERNQTTDQEDDSFQNRIKHYNLLKDFTFARFLISCAHEQASQLEDSNIHARPQCSITRAETLLRYL